LEANKPIGYIVETVFYDAEDGYLETSASLEVDLSEYSNEIEGIVIKAMIDIFLG